MTPTVHACGEDRRSQAFHIGGALVCTGQRDSSRRLSCGAGLRPMTWAQAPTSTISISIFSDFLSKTRLGPVGFLCPARVQGRQECGGPSIASPALTFSLCCFHCPRLFSCPLACLPFSPVSRTYN